MKESELEEMYHNTPTSLLRMLGWSASFRFNAPQKQTAIKDLFELLTHDNEAKALNQKIEKMLVLVEDEIEDAFSDAERNITHQINVLRRTLRE